LILWLLGLVSGYTIGGVIQRGSDKVIKARSPFGYVLADPGTVFDFYVGENSAEVVAVRGKVSPVHAATSQVRRLGWIPVSPSGPESGYI
jgi:hypothetical protein